jgi:hypothetical protein
MCRLAWNLGTPPFLEPSGPALACAGIALPLLNHNIRNCQSSVVIYVKIYEMYLLNVWNRKSSYICLWWPFDIHSIYTMNEGGKVDTKIWNRPTPFFSTTNYSTVRHILIKDVFHHRDFCVQNHNLLVVDKTCALADICFIFCCRGEQDLHEDGGFNPFFITQITHFPTILCFS